jgi:hypothetical protein
MGRRFVEERDVSAAYIQTCVGSTTTTRLRPAGAFSPPSVFLLQLLPVLIAHH